KKEENSNKNFLYDKFAILNSFLEKLQNLEFDIKLLKDTNSEKKEKNNISENEIKNDIFLFNIIYKNSSLLVKLKYNLDEIIIIIENYLENIKHKNIFPKKIKNEKRRKKIIFLTDKFFGNNFAVVLNSLNFSPSGEYKFFLQNFKLKLLGTKIEIKKME
ncbi:MAG: hypothetical protein LBF97_05450, partial [Elusimicrobiota bacterium]|nr:hypothetical protein [Elusimicrobiota bacterium]